MAAAWPYVGRFIRSEWFLGVGLATVVVFYLFESQLFAGLGNPAWFAALFAWLFAIVLGSALGVVRHAECLSERLGEPYGTLVLTLSVTSIEVMSITAVMLHGENNPTLMRDTLFAVVMIVLGGMVGVSLLFGALRYKEQYYNLQGANAYLGVIVPLAVFTLILPDFTITTPDRTLSGLQELGLALMSLALYATFLVLQTGRHRGYFTLGDEKEHHPAAAGDIRILPHVNLLLAYIVIVVFLVEHLAKPIDYLVETLRAPAMLGGITMAVLVATPEALGAVRAALADHLQRSVNIFLGSVLATIGLTVPAMLAVGRLTRHELILGLEHSDLVLLILTLAVCVITFASGRANLLQGAVHVLLFLAFVLLIFQG
ncbi:calcium:proton antiporter [Mesorhizobium sp. BAC0120]|uniref:calcium:proton antiporter n=1 Tax=Mesorhizobium sp. BAC0120 TaxID=3090670 RepID=UPI00298BFD08|nr:calcium:proton antiporter [Mesorhizobium sp. BAC0120]MDW6021553.1 calcium:proton antiporter [Mesorhizobium sp. BAC0120]